MTYNLLKNLKSEYIYIIYEETIDKLKKLYLNTLPLDTISIETNNTAIETILILGNQIQLFTA